MPSRWQPYLPQYVTADLASHGDESPVGREQRFDVVALFADIAGFTSLSEALGRADKTGTEELTSIINQGFAPLIDLIHQHGGIVSTFGGDALTALFPLRDEPAAVVGRRAAQCALRMQELMPRFAALPTAAGPWSLSLKVGLAAGPVLQTSVGDPALRTVPVVAGEALLRCAEAEGLAEAGEVVIHYPSLPLDGARLDTLADGPFCLVRALSHKASLAEPTPALDLAPGTIERITAYLHPAIVARLRDDQAALINERRNVSVIFVCFDDFDYDRDTAAGGRLQAYFAEVLRIVERYGGYLNKIEVGDKGSTYLVLFGAPLAHENDVERASHCALDLRAIEGNEVRIGINTGFVFCGLIGSDARREYTVIGDVVNLAARLMQAAQPNQILLSRPTAEALGPAFLTAPLPALVAKGKAGPVDLFELTGLRAALIRGQEPTYALPIVGRAAELAAISERIALVKRGKGQIVGITGDAGMGKSRLAAEIRRIARANRLAVYGGECLSYGTNISYLLWHNLWRSFFNVDPAWPLDLQMLQLRAQLAVIDERLLEWMPLMTNALRLPISDEALSHLLDVKSRKELLESMLIDCLLHRASESPLLLVLEDCHWIDPLSQDLLENIAIAIADAPVMIVAVYRPLVAQRENGGAPAWHQVLTRLPAWSEIRLTEFSPAETEELIRLKLQHILGAAADLPPTLAERIAARAQGNPFYIEELINLLADQQKDGDLAEHLAALELPDSLHRLIISRIDQLDEGPRNTLKVASVIGRLFKANWLTGAYPQLGPADQVSGHLETLSSLDLTPLDRTDPEPEYLFKHVITQEVAYESLSFASRAALHEQIGAYIETAYGAESAADLLAHHYGFGANLDKQREYFRRAGDAAAARYANDAAIAYYRRLMPLLPDAEKSPVMFALGDVLKLTGSWRQAEELYHELLDLARRLADPVTAARTWSDLAETQSSQGQHQAALESCAHAERYASDSPSPLLLVRVLLRKGWILSYCGQLHEALAVSRQAIGLSTALGDERLYAFGLKLQGYMHILLGETATGIMCFTEALAIHRRLEDREDEGRILNVLGETYRMHGDYAAAVAYYQRALQIGRELRHPERLIMYLSNLGGATAGLGEYDAAIAALEEALHLAKDTNWYGLPETYAFLAQAHLGKNNPQQALEAAYRGLSLARAAKQILEVGGSLRVLGSILPMLNGEAAVPADIPADPAACFAEALGIHRSVGAQSEAARTLRDWARYDLARGDQAGGRARLEQARAEFQRLGMAAELARLENDQLSFS